MLKINNLCKVFENPYKEDTVIFNDLCIETKKGEFISIIGSNGTGKSTLLNIISGSLSETSGSISIDDKDITRLKEHEKNRFINRVFQNPTMGTCPSMTVRENLALALNKGKLISFRKCNNYNDEYLCELLEDISLDLKSYLDVEAKYLSGGQRQALSLVMSSVSNPKVLLLDEHTAALDPKTSNEIMILTDKIVKEKNITTLMVTHNLKHAIEYGDRIIMLHNGEIILDLSGEEKKNLSIDFILEKFEYAV